MDYSRIVGHSKMQSQIHDDKGFFSLQDIFMLCPKNVKTNLLAVLFKVS